jgi:RNA polymerase sigma-70 factor (ECF subfamily)
LNNRDEDKSLFDAMKEGSESAFTALYDKYWERAYYVAYKHTQSEQESEDLVHDVFMDLWKNRNSITIKKEVSTYVFTALKYKIFRMYDAKAVRTQYADMIKNKQPEISNTTEKTLSFNELYSLIEYEVERLPEKCRIVFKMRRFENFTIEEIAQKLDISPNTVNNQITKASKSLKLSLKGYLNSMFFLF